MIKHNSDPLRILVRCANWVGDVVMSVPALKEIRRIFPDAYISLWAKSNLEDLVRGVGISDDLVLFDKTAGGPLRRPFRLRKTLAEGRHDLLILLQNAFESAFTGRLAGIPLIAGFPTDLRGPLLNIAVPMPEGIKSKHQVFYYLAITEFLERKYSGIAGPSQNQDCSIIIPDRNMDEAKKLLSDSIGPRVPFFCLCPGSVNSEAKRWPAKHFARLGDLMVEKVNSGVVFLGAPEEKVLIDGILGEMKFTGANFAGKTDMLTSMALMKLSRSVISNDTGSAHLAVAARARVLTIFGPTTPGVTAPFGPDAHIIKGHAPCAPCRHFVCPVSDHPCMSGIRPETVYSELISIIGDKP